MNRFRFIHLNVHSHYSINDGCASIKELIDAAIKDKMPGVAITDNSNMFGTRTPTVQMSSVSSVWSASTSTSSRITVSSTVSAQCFATPTSSTTATYPTPTSSAPKPFAKAATCATSASSATRKAKFGNGRRAFDFFWRLPRKTTTFAVSKTTPYSK